jgi:hypothetical protein
MRRGDRGIRRKTVAEGIQQRREEDELGRADGRNKKEDGSGRREEDELGRGDGRNKKEDGSGRNTTKERRK